MAGLKDWVEAARPKTLPAAVAPIAIGSAEAYRQGFFDTWPILICLAFALLVQIATNLANDYFDCIKGADTQERLGPERMAASGRIAPRAILIVALAMFALAFCIGLSLVAYRGWELLVVGIVSIAMGYAYTGGPYPLAYHGLGDVFVVLFFGLVATMGTFYVIAGSLSPYTAVLGLALGLLANNILVINNYRDRETDAKAGKRTLAVSLGDGFSKRQYVWQHVIAGLCVLYVWEKSDNLWVLLPLALAPLAWKNIQAVKRLQGAQLNALLGKTAQFLLLFSMLLTVGIVIGS